MKKILLITLIFFACKLSSLSQIPYLWGVSIYGGSTYGSIFNINGDGSGFNVPLVLDGYNGGNPIGDLLYTNDGILYGAAYTSNAQNDYGVIFSYNIVDSDYNVLIDFTSILGGSWPTGGLMELWMEEGYTDAGQYSHTIYPVEHL